MHRYKYVFLIIEKLSIFAPQMKSMNIMNIKLVAIWACLILFLGTSCSVPKDVVYFQGIDSLTPEQVELMNQNYTSKICPDDRLSITVTAWDATVVTPFNPPVYAYAAEGEEKIQVSQQLQTYLVDKEGNINFPVLGKIHVAGLSKQELIEKLRIDISKYVKDVNVNVQIVNYKITMMGEVSRPGTVQVYNDRITILDALGRVGDLTINANRKNILVIRDNDGQKEFGRLDVTNPSVFSSPFFYLRQNDVVYVEPNDAKKRNARYSQAQQYSISVFSSILSAISVITSVIIAITR